MLRILLVAFHLVSTDVIRDDGFYDYEGQFTVVHKGRMLRVLMYFNNVQPEECALHCVRHLRCRTFNYHHVKKACELTDEDFYEMDSDKVSFGWYNHGTPPKANGGWSSWRNFTDCTKKCGGGTLEQWRDCDSPKAEYGGDDCKGEMRRRVKCNTQQCIVVDVAKRKVAKQSTTLDSNQAYGPSKAVDRVHSTRAITKPKYNQWWEVDMNEVNVIKNIRLHGYVEGLLVETRRRKGDSWILCKDLENVTSVVTEFTCNEQLTIAQFLRIRSTILQRLYLNEVYVFGYSDN